MNVWANHGLKRIFKTGYRYKKAGVTLGDIWDEHVSQGDMFEKPSLPSDLIKTMDKLNARYGRGMVKLSADGSPRKSAMKQDNKSPCVTTSWDDLPQRW